MLRLKVAELVMVSVQAVEQMVAEPLEELTEVKVAMEVLR